MAVGDDEGVCPDGRVSSRCAVSSGHGERACLGDHDCCDDPPGCIMDPPVAGECTDVLRACHLDDAAGNGSY
jgi:hypothetical protein